jgi:hypothetical protein
VVALVKAILLVLMVVQVGVHVFLLLFHQELQGKEMLVVKEQLLQTMVVAVVVVLELLVATVQHRQAVMVA